MCPFSMDKSCYVLALTLVMQLVVITQHFSLYFILSCWAYCLVEKKDVPTNNQ